ncbi:2-amino-4-hydroxy-6-hydroxymethyldihydropteridine diphosphokinase [Verrucomicrobia bacterium]|nr:2-amino-4-hydroxy-6-hydroxymethyldihydropteridine diphosphokinase [Verrucomicrobiota bacterium]
MIQLNYGIAFGSNLGNRLSNLRQAKRLLLHHCPSPKEATFSPIYETQPVDCALKTNNFLNAVANLQLSMAPEDALDLCIKIESTFDRPEKREKNAPRTIDLDIIYAGSLIHNSKKLTIPHPKLYERRFVLEPLSVIMPTLVLTNQKKTILQLLNDIESSEPPLSKITNTW